MMGKKCLVLLFLASVYNSLGNFMKCNALEEAKYTLLIDGPTYLYAVLAHAPLKNATEFWLA